MTGSPEPLILTLELDGESFAVLDGLRRRYFPPERNVVPAHLTLFHALPGAEFVRVSRELDAQCREQAPFDLHATGLRFLGRGVAVAFSAPPLVQLRQRLAREWADWLTPQDSAKIAPHVTVQNKVAPDEARGTMGALAGRFDSFVARGEGLHLWRYMGGPWASARRFRFTGGR